MAEAKELIFTNLKSKSSQSMQSGKGKKQIIVIGAGMAGVTAARELVRDGYVVTLLEAREEVGGRGRNFNCPVDNYSFPLGPMYMHNAGDGIGIVKEMKNPLSALLALHHISTQTMFEEDPTGIMFVGDKISSMDPKKIFEFYAEFSSKFEFELMEIINSKSSAEAVLAAKLVQRRKVASSGIDSQTIHTRERVLMSRNFIDGAFTSGPDHFLNGVGGYQRLISELHAEATGIETNAMPGESNKKLLRTEFGQQVLEIDCTADRAVVTTQKGKFEADAVVCTIPLSVLKREKVKIKSLPKEIKEAMEHFDMGLQTKVILTFPKPFWKACKADYISIIDTTEGADPITSFLNLYKLSGGKTNTLMVSFYADDAHPSIPQDNIKNDKKIETEQKSLQEKKVNMEQEKNESAEDKDFQEKLVTKAKSTLAKIYGGDILEPVFTHVTRWYADPFTYGSWTTTSPQTSQADYDALNKGAFGGKLVFAGDYYTLKLTGSIHSAHLSGKDAKAKIDQFFGFCLQPSAEITEKRVNVVKSQQLA